MIERQAPSTSSAGMSIRSTCVSLATVHGLIANREKAAVKSFSTAAGDTWLPAK